ncbi:MAG: acetyl-CoA carboxylase carboxyltransferase subunit alpha, partial [Caloramator sp.]|nr:acetyl-CoA carboxylase carboxyltransferase subunit alpha [Caloramator sp.]
MSVLDLDKKIEELEIKIEELRKISTENNIDLTNEIEKMEIKLLELRNDLSSRLTPWDRVVLARMNDRPTSLDYIEMIFDDFIEFHGDRLYGDDPAIVGGIATLNGIPVTVIGEQKGRNTKENLYRNFGMPHPEGYRKALRLMKQAEKFKRPIITFIDTPGAYCGIGAEERGQAEAIARNLMEMSTIETLKIAIVIGEGSSGGALAISVADEIWMLENAVYSILSPEGFASILWKDASRAKEAADVMKMTAFDLKELGIISRIIKEPAGGAHKA